MNKLYYTIGEVSEMSGVEPHMLRYWEKQIPEFHPQKHKSGKRLYDEKALHMVMMLKQLIIVEKHTISGARGLLKEAKKAPFEATASALPKDLAEIRHFLKELHDAL